jgi:predicted porin
VDGAVTNFVGLGADHALSKRTIVYVSLGRSKPAAAEVKNAYGVGVSHSF